MSDTRGIAALTPVIVGVGQSVEGIDDADYRGLSPIDLAVAAVRRAIADTGADESSVVSAVDVVAATRQFEDSSPRAPAHLGKSTRFPLSVSNRLGIMPRRAVLEVVGGQSPQHLVSEFAREIRNGTTDVALLIGAEAISTVRHLAKLEDKPDFSDDPVDINGVFEDRGYGLQGLVSREQVSHGLLTAPAQYAMLENARRAALGASRSDYARSMAELFAPFTEVAAENPLSAAPIRRSATDLITVTERNRMIADPYTRFLVARDQVNQGAALLVMSQERATDLGIDPTKWVYLHGQADLRERDLFDRNAFGEAPSAIMAVRHALDVAGVTVADIDFFDFYSCFPIAVSNLTTALGISPDDPRRLTLTGGLPYFGGAGNNYSMHAIAEAVTAVRAKPRSLALVSANGGVLSKTSVGIYGSAPIDLRTDRSEDLQRTIDAACRPQRQAHPHGSATIETYTVLHSRDGKTGVVFGRLEADDARFIAQVAADDIALMDLLEQTEQPIGQRVWVTALGIGNRVTLSERTANELFPPSTPRLRDRYEFISLRRDDHLLEITLNRPSARNALHPPAHEELEEVFDAFFAEPDLWVAIITGEGPESFCAGNDLVYGASGKPMYLPLSGFAGLTSRSSMTKPVIAAVNGFAMGGGFEIVLACHLVVADETAQFALSEVKVGLIAAAGGLARLPRSIPSKFANDLILTGRRIGVDEAQRLGVVNRIAPVGGALDAARALAREVTAGSPTSIRLSLTAMEHAARIPDVLDAVMVPSEIRDELMTSADAAEGMEAFALKREPRWLNR